MRHISNLIIDNSARFRQQVLAWADTTYNTVCCFDNNHYKDYSHHSFETLIAAGQKDFLQLNSGNAFSSLKKFYEQKKDWLFGFFGYDLKNETERLQSKNFDGLGFPDLFFFQPEWVIEIHGKNAIVHSFSEESIIAALESAAQTDFRFPSSDSILLQARLSHVEYLETVEKIRRHIARGDIYELNFCQEFFAENARLEPLKIFGRLNEISRAPFSCYLKHDGNYLLSASPERFLKKLDDRLISMPMKGTIHRGTHEKEDKMLRAKLFNSKKERSENVMIVDLVRNDLSKICVAGSVKVDELFGIKTFPQVLQMVSTISGTLRHDVHFIDAIRNAFPMGSMTGAPKIKAMELIEQYEKSKRGLYSGAAGYITPAGDFDFNVVIRSILYNRIRQYLSFHVGSAIVFDSVPQKEYEECLLKAKALMEAVGINPLAPAAFYVPASASVPSSII